MAKILISGGSGLIGKNLTAYLIKHGYEVQWLSRKPGIENGIKKFKWNIDKGEIDVNAFNEVDTIIHLAGEGIVEKAWTESYKQAIQQSRAKSSELLLSALVKNNIRLKSFIGSSAVGYYGSTDQQIVIDETMEAGDDFMANTCLKWEQAQTPFKQVSQQFVILRIGIVLSSKGGALQKMSLPFKYGFGASLASGQQYLPWIHEHDLIRLYLFIKNNPSLNGTFNAVSSQIITNTEFSKTLALVYQKPFFLPNVPEWLLKLFLGERQVSISRGLKISNKKILEAGFKFEYNQLNEALNQLIRSTPN